MFLEDGGRLGVRLKILRDDIDHLVARAFVVSTLAHVGRCVLELARDFVGEAVQALSHLAICLLRIPPDICNAKPMRLERVEGAELHVRDVLSSLAHSELCIAAIPVRWLSSLIACRKICSTHRCSRSLMWANTLITDHHMSCGF